MVVQNNGKEIYIKKCAARAKLFFFLLIRPTDLFGYFVAVAAKHYTISYFVWLNLYIIIRIGSFFRD